MSYCVVNDIRLVEILIERVQVAKARVDVIAPDVCIREKCKWIGLMRKGGMEKYEFQ